MDIRFIFGSSSYDIPTFAHKLKWNMKLRIIISSFLLLISCGLFTQVGINTNEPHPDTDLHLASPNKRLMLNHVSDFVNSPSPAMV